MSADDRRDLTEITRAISALFAPGDMVELRALDVGGKTIAGYFDDHTKLVEAAAKQSGQATGVYVTLNQINSDLLARSANRLTVSPKNLTQDIDVVRRCYLPVDVDAVRAKGISSTNAEHEAAIAAARDIREYLIMLSFPQESIILGDSGNGGHLLARIDLPNDTGVTALIKQCLEALGSRFSNECVTIDRSVFNPARIWKLPGTLARKGDSTSMRPHRIARLLDVPATLTVAGIEALKVLAATLPATEAAPARAYQGRGQPLDLVTWLQEHNIAVKSTGPYEGGIRYILQSCVFNPDHGGTSAAVFEGADGKLGYKCQHNGCSGKTWSDVRELFEPGYKNRRHAGTVLTDTTNAEFIADLYGDRLRYDHLRGRWLLWAGHYWQEDADGEVYRLAIEGARERYRRSIVIEDLKERQRVASWAIGSEQRGRLEAAVALEKNVRPIADSGRGWDEDPWLFAVRNGVVDLRSGELRRGRPEDRITLHSEVEYDPTAWCPRWMQFLEEVMGDNDLVDYIWRLAGYSMSGVTHEQVYAICYGSGANGKGRFLAALRHVLGDYFHDAPFVTFEITNRSAIPNDLAALERRRFVTSSETNEGTRLNEARLKMLSGEDPCTARYLREEFFTFMPVCKIWLAVNHKPRVVDDSYGFWRRVRLIPFTRQFKGKADDKRLLEKLQAEAPGILNWLIAGCLEWQKRGLDPAPATVMSATTEYQTESDPLSQFITDVCIEAPNAFTKASELYKAYSSWAIDQGLREKERMSNTFFGKRLKSKYAKKDKNDGAYYLGIGLKVVGLVVGSEYDVSENNVFSQQNELTRENIEKSPLPTTPTTNGDNPDNSEPPTEFVLTDQWQEIPEGYAVPGGPGMEVKMNMATGKTEARWVLPSSGEEYVGEFGLEDSPVAAKKTAIDRREAVLGMPVARVLEMWRAAGAPEIKTEDGKIMDLAKCLSHHDVLEKHLHAVRRWLDSVGAKQ